MGAPPPDRASEVPRNFFREVAAPGDQILENDMYAQSITNPSNRFPRSLNACGVATSENGSVSENQVATMMNRARVASDLPHQQHHAIDRGEPVGFQRHPPVDHARRSPSGRRAPCRDRSRSGAGARRRGPSPGPEPAIPAVQGPARPPDRRVDDRPDQEEVQVQY